MMTRRAVALILICAISLASIGLGASGAAAAVRPSGQGGYPGDYWDNVDLTGDNMPPVSQGITYTIGPEGGDPLVQQHTFYAAYGDTGDSDWYRFVVTYSDISNLTGFLFEARSTTLGVEPVIEIFDMFANQWPPSNEWHYPGPDWSSWADTGCVVANRLWAFGTAQNLSAALGVVPGEGFTPWGPGTYYVRVRPNYDTVNDTYGDRAGPYEFSAKKGLFRRLAGPDRYGTAVRISRETFYDRFAEVGYPVVIANGWRFPDALAGAAFADASGSSLLLCAQSSMPATTLAEIKRLKPTKAYVLGGTAAVGQPVVSALQGLGLPVTRLDGPDRYATASRVARAVVTSAGATMSKLAFVVNGEAWPDALACTPVSANGSHHQGRYTPILLTHKDYLDQTTVDALNDLGVTDVVIAGSTAVVSQQVQQTLTNMRGASHVLRIGGANRYETAKLVALWSLDQYGPGAHGGGSIGTTASPNLVSTLTNSNAGDAEPHMAIASGEDFPDALAGGRLCGRLGYPLLLTPKSSLSPEVWSTTGWTPLGKHDFVVDAIPAKTFKRSFVFGGPPAVSTGVMTTLDTEVGGRPHSP